MQISVGYQLHESWVGNTKHLNLHQPKTYMCKCKVDQHLLVLNVYSILISKILK